MKKIISAFVLFFSATALTFTSCGGGGNNDNNQDVKEDTSKVKQTVTQDFSAGKAIFTAKCAVCHQATGLGVPGTFPNLAGSDYLANKQLVVKSVLNGLKGKITVNGKEFGSVAMPPNALTDQEAADVLNYVFNSWGNKLGTITVGDVTKFKTSK
jgi:nitrite reductase (NO-forming)